MSARNSPSPLDLLSVELLEQIFLLTSVQDIIWLTLVKDTVEVVHRASVDQVNS
jgi:hypothetical protein